MNILVTGGAGFIGSAVVRHILENTNNTVINVDALTYAGNLESIPSELQSERYVFQQVDICDYQALKQVFDEYEPDLVMHLAAESHVDRSIEGPGAFINTNVIGTFNMLECARHHWQNLTADAQAKFKFHHISTDEVYGDLEGTDDLFTEQTPYAPSSPYSASKAGSDHLVRAWGRTYGLPIVVTNCSNNYGPYHFPEKLIPHVICELLEELVPNKPEGITNYKDLITFVKDRPGHDVRYAIDATKMQQELNWVPEETFETGMRKTVEWYLANTNWWQRVLNGDYKLDRIGENTK